MVPASPVTCLSICFPVCISLRAQSADQPKGIKRKNFEAITLQWIELAKAPVAFQVKHDQDRCDEIINTSELDKQSEGFCDLLVLYLEKYEDYF